MHAADHDHAQQLTENGTETDSAETR